MEITAAASAHRRVSGRVLGAAMAVHRELGPGFLAAAYEEALCHELRDRGMAYARQVGVVVRYRGAAVDRHRVELIVEGAVVVAVKAAPEIDAAHVAAALAVVRAASVPSGLVLGFGGVALRARQVRNDRGRDA